MVGGQDNAMPILTAIRREVLTTRRIIVKQIEEIKNVAIVGTGVIGASWAAYYLSRGLSVVATDPAPNAEAGLRKYVDEAWKILSKTGLSPNASRNRLSFAPSMAQAH